MGTRCSDLRQWNTFPHLKVSIIIGLLDFMLMLMIMVWKVPFQINSCDCGVFSLLFIHHLRYGYLNHPYVRPEYRFEMNGPVEGRVAGDLVGTRLAFAEDILSTVQTDHRLSEFFEL